MRAGLFIPLCLMGGMLFMRESYFSSHYVGELYA